MGQRLPQLRYRVQATEGAPPIGAIIMGRGARVRSAYRVLGAVKVKPTRPMLGILTWRVTVERMSREAAEAEVAAGAPRWFITWDKR